MTGAELLTALRERLGNRSTIDLPTATILAEAELVRTTILERTTFFPWFLQDEDVTVSTVASTEYVSLPSDFLGFDPEDEWSGIAYQDPADTSADPWVPIAYDDFNIIKAKYKDAVTGKPVAFGLVGTRAYFRPIPDAVYSLRFRHYKTDATFPSDGTTNLWLTYAPDWVMGEVGFILASQYVKDMEAAQAFVAMKQEARKRCYYETVKRQESGKARQMGDE